MSLFHRLVLILFLISLSTVGQENHVELSIQQGHSDNIQLVAVSDNLRFCCSVDEANKVILWDVKTGNQVTFFYLLNPVLALQFRENNLEVEIITISKHYVYSVQSNKFLEEKLESVIDKKNVQTKTNNVTIEDATITLFAKNSQLKIKSQTSDYFDQPFTQVVYSSSQQKIFASCQDGNIYVYNDDLKFEHHLKGHFSNVNSLTLSRDGNYLFSASSDRSIIQWDCKTSKIVKRFSGRSYRTDGVSIDKSGSNLNFGDEIGFVKSINLSSASLDVKSERVSIYPVTFTAQTFSKQKIYAGQDNKLIINDSLGHTKKIRVSRIMPRLIAHKTITDVLHLYKPHYSEFHEVGLSQNDKFMIYLCQARGNYPSYYQLVDLKNHKKSKRLFHVGHHFLTKPFFINDSLVGSLDLTVAPDLLESTVVSQFDALTLWRVNDGDVKNIWTKKISFGISFTAAEKLTEDLILLLTAQGQLFSFSISEQKIKSTSLSNVQSLFNLAENLTAIVDLQNHIHIIQSTETAINETALLQGHQDLVTSCAYDRFRNRLFTSSKDATVRVWDLDSAKLLLTIIPIGSQNAIYVTPENYYMTTSKDLNSFGFKVNENYFYPEQFDPVFNRPDIILETLGYCDSNLIRAYHQAYLKRIEKLGFTSEMLKTDFHLPKIDSTNLIYLPQELTSSFIDISLKASDKKYPLDRINLWINDVAIYGANGISVKTQNTNQIDTTIHLNLAYGSNKIQISVVNQAGAESYKTTSTLNCLAGESKNNLYLIAIGCSNFKDNKYNLNYAAKDAEDFISLFSTSNNYAKINAKKLVNEEVTLSNILKLQSFLKDAKINDEVMIFFAGHGVLDVNLDYYLASHDMDFLHPEKLGIPYSAIENLVDGIAPLRKLIFIDACHSGELDKSEVLISDENNTKETGDLTFRKVGNSIQQKEFALGLQSTSQLTKSLFADLRKGTGATIISSAGGMEFAIESNTWKNGLFTFCLIEGIKTKKADLNKDGKIMLSELQNYVGAKVIELSGGRQQPTSRIENNSIDYRIW